MSEKEIHDAEQEEKLSKVAFRPKDATMARQEAREGIEEEAGHAPDNEQPEEVDLVVEDQQADVSAAGRRQQKKRCTRCHKKHTGGCTFGHCRACGRSHKLPAKYCDHCNKCGGHTTSEHRGRVNAIQGPTRFATSGHGHRSKVAILGGGNTIVHVAGAIDPDTVIAAITTKQKEKA